MKTYSINKKENHFEEVQVINADEHFENFDGPDTPAFGSPQNHADIFDTATSVPVYGQAYGAVRSIGNTLSGLVGGGGPDITQRQKDFQKYSSQGFVLGGDPKNDGTWIFNLDYLSKNPVAGYQDAIFGHKSGEWQHIFDRYAGYLAQNPSQIPQGNLSQLFPGDGNGNVQKLSNVHPAIVTPQGTAPVSGAQATGQSGFSGAASLASITGNISPTYLVGGFVLVVLVIVGLVIYNRT